MEIMAMSLLSSMPIIYVVTQGFGITIGSSVVLVAQASSP